MFRLFSPGYFLFLLASLLHFFLHLFVLKLGDLLLLLLEVGLLLLVSSYLASDLSLFLTTLVLKERHLFCYLFFSIDFQLAENLKAFVGFA